MDSKLLIHGGRLLAKAVEKSYAEGQTDYSIEPLVRMDESGTPVGSIQEGDAVIFCCRRGEREIEFTEAFTEPDFSHFERQKIKDLNFIILTLYHEKFKDLPVAFAPSNVRYTLGEIVSRAGLRQLRCSETEKFAHITFFLNGGINKTFPGEDHIRIPSPKGIPFDQVPELSLPKVADEVINGIHSGYDLIITNFANGDVIGHTASSQAKIQCAEHMDKHLGRVVQQAKQNDYVIAITADHGNLELMLTEDGKPHVAHTTNPVPFILIDPKSNVPLSLNDGSLQDIAPTILNILGIPQPEEMTGNDLSDHHDWGTKRHALLIILDGWGKGKEDHTNPIYLANTPVWDELVKEYPPALLQASGDSVGLQEGKAGNSEAGHMNIGAGRVVLQDDVRLDQAIKDGTFSTNAVFLQAIKGVKDRHSHLHLIGLLTERSSHGSIDYLLAVLKIARDIGVQDIYLHLIFDGRSTEPGSASALLEKLDAQLAEIGAGVVATGMGRGIALDRDGNYGKIQRAYEALVMGKGRRYS